MIKQIASGGPFRIALALVLVAGGSALAGIPDVGTSKDPGAAVEAVAGPTGIVGPTAGAGPTGPTGPSGPTGPEALAIEGGAKRTVSFNEAHPPTAPTGVTGIAGPLPVVVDPPPRADGRLRVTYTSDYDGAVQTVGADPGTLTGRHGVVYAATAREGFAVTGGAPVTIPLRVALPADAPIDRANGRVRVEFYAKDAREPTAVGGVEVTGAPPAVRVVPQTAKLRITRGLGPLSRFKTSMWLYRDQAGVHLLGPGVEAFRARGEQRVRLATERNGELLGTLRFPERSGLAPNYAEVEIDTVTLTGKYVGGVPLDPNGPSDATVPLEVEVQDHFGWPLILLFGSAFLGGYVVLEWNLKRRRSILHGVLRKIAERYAVGRARAPWLFELDERLGLEDPTYPSERDPEPARGWSKLERLNIDIGTAANDAELADAAKRVEDIGAEVERWHRIRAEAEDLRAEVTRTRLPEGDDALHDSASLLHSIRHDDPGSGEATDTLLGHLTAQQRIVGRYAELRRDWSDLSDAQRAAIPESDPAKVYVLLADRTAAQWQSLPTDLERALDRVRRVPADPSPAAGIEALGMRARSPLPVQASGGVPARAAPTKEPLTGARILADVGRGDLLVALATTLVATVAFLYPIYVDNHTFGSWEDYLKLALLGFLGAGTTGGLVLDWLKYPVFRSYTAAAAGAPTPAGGGDGAGGDGEGGDAEGGGDGGDPPKDKPEKKD